MVDKLCNVALISHITAFISTAGLMVLWVVSLWEFLFLFLFNRAFKPEASMSAGGNLTLNKPLCAHFGPILRCPVCLYLSQHIMEGHLHVYLSLKLVNKLKLLPSGYLCHFCLKTRQSGSGVREGWRRRCDKHFKEEVEGGGEWRDRKLKKREGKTYVDVFFEDAKKGHDWMDSSSAGREGKGMTRAREDLLRSRRNRQEKITGNVNIRGRDGEER